MAAADTKKLFTIFGVTGNQGGAIARTFHDHPKLRTEYRLRGVTRNAQSEKAKGLKARGIEVVEADLNSPETVSKAVEGSSIVFGITNYWDPSTGEKETQQGKNIANACRDAKVDYLIWSSLPGKHQIDKITAATSTTGPAESEKCPEVPHFETKAKVEEYIKTDLKGKLDAIFILPGFFLDNFISPLFRPKQDKGTDSGDGKGDHYTLTMPFEADVANIPLYTPADMGVYVGALVLSPRKEVINQQWPATSEIRSGREIANAISEATGKHVEYKAVEVKDWTKGLPDMMRDEFEANMQLIRSPGYYGSQEVARSGERDFAKLIEKTEVGKLTDMVEFFKQNLKLD